MKASTYCAFVISCVVTLFGITTISAQSPPSRARTLELRAYLSSPPGTPPDVSCSDGVSLPRKKGEEAPLIASFDSASCDARFALGKAYMVDGRDDIAKDTLEHYIESCYADPFCCTAFTDITGAVGGTATSANNIAWLTYREWLFKVLYFSTDTSYYCEDAASTIATFNYYGLRGTDVAGQIAVEKYLSGSGKCSRYQSNMQQGIPLLYRRWHLHWMDTVKDSVATHLIAHFLHSNRSGSRSC